MPSLFAVFVGPAELRMFIGSSLGADQDDRWLSTIVCAPGHFFRPFALECRAIWGSYQWWFHQRTVEIRDHMENVALALLLLVL
eukprot:2812290-Pyramimonas_sp.AAC.1